MIKRFAFILFLFIPAIIFAQSSIHMEESAKYASLGARSVEGYDQLSGFEAMDEYVEVGASGLDKVVFGYHPYWGGSNYLNYQWDLLSDLCYFSYEVDPETGYATTIHDWLTSPAIDSAFATGTRVHLCVTLFSGHGIFFNNPLSRRHLTYSLIDLVNKRGADGVSFDFELVPSSQGENMVNYIAEFAAVFADSVPGGTISLAMPSVDWSGIFDVEELNQYIDLYMIMAYDYYWNGSSQAGPTDPHYSMTSGYQYNVSRTVSYYQHEGMPLEKMLLGIPYYAREWPTASGEAPSSTTGNGTAYTWAKIKNNTSGNYSLENKQFEPNSHSPYFAYNDNGWHQCFVNDIRSLNRRYKMVNRRGMAGIGIWALGYDNGHTDLWETIDQHFAQGTQITWFDTIYDSGGPSWEYYNDEEYTLTLHGEENEAMRLEFSSFGLETGYDSLWVYDGYYPGGILLGGFTGNNLPPVLYSGDVMSLRFYSDHATTASGWTAMVESFMISVEEKDFKQEELSVYPNPAFSVIQIKSETDYSQLQIYSLSGQLMYSEMLTPGTRQKQINISAFPAGVYLLIVSDGLHQSQEKIIKY